MIIKNQKNIKPGVILDIWGMSMFLGQILWKKAFCLLAHPKYMLFLSISDENIFFKTQGTRLSVIVAPNKSLE